MTPKIKVYKKEIEEYLCRINWDENAPNLYEPIKYTIQNFGKQIRPVLTLMSANALGATSDVALPAAICLEVFHNFTLLHDDIMDDAPIRRGKPSVYKKYGTNAAILSGDVMLIKAYQFLENYEGNAFKQLTHLFSKSAQEVCEGQQMDIDFETSENVSIPQYIKMIELKTAVLIAAALKMGAIVGAAPDDTCGHLYEFGKNLGIAFQIQDDILDSFGDSRLVGKQIGGDIIQKKKTYLYLKTLELMTESDRHKFRELYNSDTPKKIEEVLKVFNEYVIKEYADQLKEAYYTLAISHLEAVNIQKAAKQPFVELANFLIKRDS